MSIEEKQISEIARLTAQVDELQQLLRNSTSKVDILRSSIVPGSQGCTESEQLQVLKAEVDHKCQKEKAIWAAIRHIAGEDVARRIEEEVSRRPIVAAPKARRRGTMPHMPVPHMTVVTKTAVAPKWPPATQSETVAPSSEGAVEVVAAPIEADSEEEAKPKFDVDIGSVPPSVARRLFGAFKGKEKENQEEPTTLPIKLRGTSCTGPSTVHQRSKAPNNSTSAFQSSRVAEVPSPMRRRESATSMSWVPPMPTAADANTTSIGSSVRDRIRQLEISSRQNSGQNREGSLTGQKKGAGIQ